MKKTVNSLLVACLVLSFAAESKTQIIIYQAYTENNVLNPSLIVAQRYTGHCFAKSLADSGRLTAWRCSTNNLIVDPCFQDGEGVMACLNSPWSDKVLVLKLSTPLHDSKAELAGNTVNTQSAQPWAIELANGQRCIALTGASTLINNRRLNYSCSNYYYNVIGKINKTSLDWKADVYNHRDNSIQAVSITTAWF